jgi:hypothetical protein
MMGTRTTTITADSARVNASNTLKLRVVCHKYAAKIAAHARTL